MSRRKIIVNLIFLAAFFLFYLFIPDSKSFAQILCYDRSQCPPGPSCWLGRNFCSGDYVQNVRWCTDYTCSYNPAYPEYPGECESATTGVTIDHSDFCAYGCTDPPGICNLPPPSPNCDTGISCSGPCNAPTNTCSVNNGTQGDCVYTTYSGGGSCNQVDAPDQPCTTDNCLPGYSCTDGTCTPEVGCVPGSTIEPKPCTSTPCGGDYCAQEIWRCRADGSGYDLVGSECSWDKDRCGTCGGGPTPTPPPGITLTPTPTQPRIPDVPEAVCQEGVSTDGNWSDNPADWPKTVTVAPGNGVAFKVRLTATKGSMNEFYLENKFDNIIDGFTNIWQNTDRDRSGLGIWQGYPPYLYSSTFPGLSFTSDWSDYGGFNTGQKDEFSWNETLTSTAQSFKNTMFFKYDSGAPPGAFRGRYDDRCWLPEPEEAPDSQDCIVFPGGCGGDWGWCSYSLYFNCNKVTVQMPTPTPTPSPTPTPTPTPKVTATITGPTGGRVEQNLSYSATIQDPAGNLVRGEIWVAKTDRSPANPSWCRGGGIFQEWCLLNRVYFSGGSSQTLSGTFQAGAAGDYYVVVNAFSSSSGVCTGSPWGPTAAWPQDCVPGNGDYRTVTISSGEPTVVALSPQGDWSGAREYGGKNNPVTFKVTYYDPDGADDIRYVYFDLEDQSVTTTPNSYYALAISYAVSLNRYSFSEPNGTGLISYGDANRAMVGLTNIYASGEYVGSGLAGTSSSLFGGSGYTQFFPNTDEFGRYDANKVTAYFTVFFDNSWTSATGKTNLYQWARAQDRASTGSWRRF